MTPPILWVLTLALAYLIGSIPTGYLLVRIFRHQDIRASGSGNIGATNVARSGAMGLGIVTLFLDVLKGLLAVVIAQHIARDSGFPNGYDLAAVAGLFAVLGHIFPVWLGFRGGKGVATALGVFLALVPLTTLFAVLIFTAIFMITRYVSLASVVAAASLAVIAILSDRKHRPLGDLVYLAIPLLVILKHSGNIRRLIAHTEPRFGAERDSKPIA